MNKDNKVYTENTVEKDIKVNKVIEDNIEIRPQRLETRSTR